MRRPVGLYGMTDETLELADLLASSSLVEVVRVYDADPTATLERARGRGGELADFLLLVATDDYDSFVQTPGLEIVVDATPDGEFHRRMPDAAARNIQVVAPRAARLLWAHDTHSPDRKTELLHVLSEMVDSVELTVDSDELFTRMLEIAISVTGADGGSLMLLDPNAELLRIRVAVGIERELWPKIRVAIGEGIAGRAVADGAAILIHGPADRERFSIRRERLDVESALCVPLSHAGRILGVLNLHHSRQREAFTDDDLSFVEQLAQLDAQIIARAEEHASLRDQAARYAAVREVETILARTAPLAERLHGLCRFIASRSEGAVAQLYLHDGDDEELTLAASSTDRTVQPARNHVALGCGIAGQVAAHGAPAFLRSHDGALSYSALPLRAGDERLGVLAIESIGLAADSRAAREMAMEICSAIARALAQVEREERMSERANRLSAINETGIRMLSARELDEVVQVAASSAAMVLDAEHVVIRLQDDESKRYVIRAYFGPADGEQRDQLFELDKRVSLAAIQRAEAYLVADTAESEELADADVRSLVVSPIRRDGQVIGTCAAYEKLSRDRFQTSSFDLGDVDVFSRFVSYVERALASAADRSRAREQSGIDTETGLPDDHVLDRRLREEITRAAGRESALALCICTIENLAEISAEAGPEHAAGVVREVARALARSLRDFDVLGRRSQAEFEVLLPDPGPMPGDRVYSIARAVADQISKDEELNRPLRIALGFGYAIHPYDGDDRDSLVASATPPRIRMV